MMFLPCWREVLNLLLTGRLLAAVGKWEDVFPAYRVNHRDGECLPHELLEISEWPLAGKSDFGFSRVPGHQ